MNEKDVLELRVALATVHEKLDAIEQRLTMAPREEWLRKWRAEARAQYRYRRSYV